MSSLQARTGQQTLSRRALLELGGLGLAGLSLPELLLAQARAARAAGRAAESGCKAARSCILFFMEGGPAHQDLWDMKPEAAL